MAYPELMQSLDRGKHTLGEKEEATLQTKRLKTDTSEPNAETEALFSEDYGPHSSRKDTIIPNIQPPSDIHVAGQSSLTPIGDHQVEMATSEPSNALQHHNSTSSLLGSGVGLDPPAPSVTIGVVEVRSVLEPAEDFIPLEDSTASMEETDYNQETTILSSRSTDRKRKRNSDDRPENLRYNLRYNLSEYVASVWETPRNATAALTTPWLETAIHNTTSKGGLTRLHHEMLAFYELFKPREEDRRVRDELVNGISLALRKKDSFFVDAACFGSVATGLFLPTGDVDIVGFTRKFYNGQDIGPKNKLNLWKLKRYLVDSMIAEEDNFEVIPKARVPIVKFTEKRTGLSVDISFDNDSGTKATAFVREWLKSYPDATVLIMVVKQFLLMRGFNEPKNGFVGGLTLVCLVVNFLKHHPLGNGRVLESLNLEPKLHLGKMLLDFFDFYGNRFDMTKTGIDMDQGYFLKKGTTSKWMIPAPWDKSHDIASSTTKAPFMMGCFSAAYTNLKQGIDQYEQQDDSKAQISILGDIIAGNYGPYFEQLRLNSEISRNPHPISDFYEDPREIRRRARRARREALRNADSHDSSPHGRPAGRHNGRELLHNFKVRLTLTISQQIVI